MIFKRFLVILTLLFCTSVVQAQGSIARGLFQTDVGMVDDQEIVMLEVEYPPGISSASHRHNAHTVVYVLEGTVNMQVAGGALQTLSAGEVFYETPDDIHSVSRNASDTVPAKILVFFLKKKDAPASEPAP
ncbi:MAG: cupin domain-containing protein [Woeseiaceae bacterium]